MATVHHLLDHLLDHLLGRRTAAIGCLLLAAAAMAGPSAVGEEVPTKQPAELLRKNGTVIVVPLLVKVRGGNVTAHSDTSIAPLTFRAGEIQAIRFQKSEPEPDVHGTSRLKYFYDSVSKSFERHRILATISPWEVSQEATEQDVFESAVRRNEQGETVVETVKKKKVVHAPTAELSATFLNKQRKPVIVNFQLHVATAGGGFFHTDEILLDGEESKDIVIAVATGGRAVTEAVISDVYNRLATR